MSPLVAINHELKKLEPKAHAENPVYLKLIRMIPPRPIENAKEHALFLKILKKISIFLNEAEADPSIRHNPKARELRDGYAQYARFIEELVTHYERDRFPIGHSTPQDMLVFLMEQHGLNQVDIAEELGGQPNVSAILSGKRELNLRQIQKLAARFQVSPATFLPAA